MPDNDPTKAPTALPGLQKNPALILTFLLALATAIATVSGMGEFNDGIQATDVGLILTQLAVGLGIKSQVFSQETVDRLAPRSEQRRVTGQRR